MNNITVEALLEKAHEAPSTFTKFVLKTHIGGKNGVYCFVEDYDMPYYHDPIYYTTKKEPYAIRCKGKTGVIQIERYLSSQQEYNDYIQLYFVDKDFDDNSNLSRNICITEGYSIENYYVGEDCIRKILITEFDLDPVDDKEKFDKCFELYRKKIQEFHEASILFNAWYARLYSDKTWNRSSVSLDNKFPKDLMKYNIENVIVGTYSLEDIHNKYPEAPMLTHEDIEPYRTYLMTNPALFCRGKFEVEFLYKFLEFLNLDASKDQCFTKKRKGLHIELDKLISSLCQYSTKPDSLFEYIQSRCH